VYGIKFNGYHSYTDKGLIMAPGKKIGRPSKEKIKIKVPFSNVEYDFSELYGSQTYTNRELTYPFNLLGKTKEEMSMEATSIINWLMNSRGKQTLWDDAIPGYHFLAEVENETDFKENWADGVITVKFTAYPFMICDYAEGTDIWDEFNFITDMVQDSSFIVNDSLETTIYNLGATDIKPTIITNADMTIVMNNKTYTIPTGTTKSYDFIFKPGENNLTITGNGTISFVFYKELI